MAEDTPQPQTEAEIQPRAPRAEVRTDSGALSELHKVEQGAGQIVHDVKAKVEALFQAGKIHLAQDIRDNWAKAKADALAAVQNDAPEAKAIAEKALAVIEDFLVKTIESHLA